MNRARPWRQAWQDALYGDEGFYRTGAGPGAHFRTSVHASGLFARAVLSLARTANLDTVVDVGAGGGNLLGDLHALDPDLRLCGVDLSPRPAGLPAAVRWSDTVPVFSGLLVANEWLDNVPCEVVAATADGPRRVLVEPATGRESLGGPPALAEADWLARWWPLTEPGQRAEVGTARDQAWAEAVGRLRSGVAVAIDYGHVLDRRPAGGSLVGYRAGRAVRPVPDGRCDLTAHVALDASAAATPGAMILSQQSALRALGLSGARPSYDRGRTDPGGYARDLAAASQAWELTDPAGLGGFGWLVQPVGGPIPAVLAARPPD